MGTLSPSARIYASQSYATYASILEGYYNNKTLPTAVIPGDVMVRRNPDAMNWIFTFYDHRNDRQKKFYVPIDMIEYGMVKGMSPEEIIVDVWVHNTNYSNDVAKWEDIPLHQDHNKNVFGMPSTKSMARHANLLHGWDPGSLNNTEKSPRARGLIPTSDIVNHINARRSYFYPAILAYAKEMFEESSVDMDALACIAKPPDVAYPVEVFMTAIPNRAIDPSLISYRILPLRPVTQEYWRVPKTHVFKIKTRTRLLDCGIIASEFYYTKYDAPIISKVGTLENELDLYCWEVGCYLKHTF